MKKIFRILVITLGIFYIVLILFIIFSRREPKIERRGIDKVKTALVYFGDTLAKGVQVDSILRIRTVGNAEVICKGGEPDFVVILRPTGYVDFRLIHEKKLMIRNETVESKK